MVVACFSGFSSQWAVQKFKETQALSQYVILNLVTAVICDNSMKIVSVRASEFTTCIRRAFTKRNGSYASMIFSAINYIYKPSLSSGQNDRN